jgi:hypothetical protein
MPSIVSAISAAYVSKRSLGAHFSPKKRFRRLAAKKTPLKTDGKF